MSTFRSLSIGACCVILLGWACAADGASLTAAWNPSPEATGYKLSWGTQSGVYSNTVDVGNQTSWQVTGLACKTAFYFVVRAYNSAGTSAPSAEASGETTAIATPGDFFG